MARVELPITVLNSTTGLPVAGASVAITQRSNAAAVTWWTAETGGTSSTAAVATDINGRATAWVARGAYNLTISGVGITTYSEAWDALPASDLGGETLWLPDAVMSNAKMASGLDATKITTGSLPTSAYGTSVIPTTAVQDDAITVAKMAAGTGGRILGLFPLNKYSIGPSSTLSLKSNSAVTHNNRGGIALLFHSFAATGTCTPTFRIYTAGAVVSSKAYTISSSAEVGLVTMTYTYPTLNGSQNWMADVTQGASSASVYGDGEGVLMIFERY